MATWRQALEVVITDEDVARLMTVSRSRTEPGCSVRRCFWRIARTRLFMPLDSGWGCIIRRSNAASSGRWPMGR